MKFLNQVLLAVVCLSLLILSSCKEKETYYKPELTIFSPEEGSLLLVPDIVMVDFSIEDVEGINYIRVSIDNKDYIPMTIHKFIYPDAGENTFSVELTIDNVILKYFKPPYCVHIVVNMDEEHNYYLELETLIRENSFNGLVVVGDNGVQSTSMQYFNKNLSLSNSSALPGEYTDFCVNSYFSSVVVATKLPYKIVNLSLKTNEQLWEKSSGAPYPGFNQIVNMNEVVYSSTNDCRIIGCNSAGNQLFVTHQLNDSVPEYFCVTDDFIFANLNLRNSGNKALQSYYLATGSRYMTYQTGGTIVSIKPLSRNKAVIFKNSNSNASIIIFNIENNYTEFVTSTDSISAICSKSDTTFLINSKNRILLFDASGNTLSIVGNISERLSEMKFEKTNNQIIGISKNQIKVYSYPQLQEQKTIDLQTENCSLDLIYSY